MSWRHTVLITALASGVIVSGTTAATAKLPNVPVVKASHGNWYLGLTTASHNRVKFGPERFVGHLHIGGTDYDGLLYSGETDFIRDAGQDVPTLPFWGNNGTHHVYGSCTGTHDALLSTVATTYDVSCSLHLDGGPAKPVTFTAIQRKTVTRPCHGHGHGHGPGDDAADKANPMACSTAVGTYVGE